METPRRLCTIAADLPLNAWRSVAVGDIAPVSLPQLVEFGTGVAQSVSGAERPGIDACVDGHGRLLAS